MRVGLQLGLQSGVTFLKKWGYTFGVFGGGVDRGGGKGMVLRDSLGETAHLRYRTNGRNSG